MEMFIALRYLQAKHIERFISVITIFSFLGIFLGVGTLIVVMSVMNGFKHDLLERILGYSGHITIAASDARMLDDADTLEALIPASENIKDVVPYIHGQVLLSTPHLSSGILVRGLDMNAAAERFGLDERDLEPVPSSNLPTIYLGQSLALSAGVRRGDQVTLLSPRGPATAFGTMPQRRQFVVGGLVNFGLHAYNSGVALMSFEAARSFFLIDGNQVSAVEIILYDPLDVASNHDELRNIFGPDYAISNWQRDNFALVSALDVERNVMFLILTLIILVAAFNIITGQLMLVREKTRAIAVLQTLGATRQMIMRIFLIVGTIIGLSSTFFGALAGVVFALNITSIKSMVESLIDSELFPAEVYYLTQLPSRIDTTQVAVVVIMAIGLTLCSALYPAWRASKIAPAQVLRNE